MEQRSRTPREPTTVTRHKGARFRIGTLNIKGFGGNNTNGIPDKWLYINQVIRDNKLAVLAIQETHLSKERTERLNRLFAASMEIISSPDPDRATGAKGVAFAINKKLLGDKKVQTHIEIEGRAMTLRYPWAPGKTITITNVYAPNRESENAEFWDVLRTKYENAPRNKPEVLLGDFNIVENPMDRIPARQDARIATEALTKILGVLNVGDSWRLAHPHEKAYTFRQNNSDSQSRLDRIYLKSGLLSKTADWNITGPGPHSDHQLVTLSIANYHAPAIGKGRWSAPLSLLDDAKFATTMRELGMKLQEDINSAPPRSDDCNPQKSLETFKESLLKEARKRIKEWIPKLDKKILTLRAQVHDLLNPKENASSNTNRRDTEIPREDRETAALIQERIQNLEAKRFGQRRATTAAKNWAEGETLSKYWSRLNAPPKPDNIILLRQPTED
ncbi:Endonuclease/exonuclease/phosphatase [Trametes maxima]|nr:Endonuclease/exonuclease/phosphatase [Trametes maxima]